MAQPDFSVSLVRPDDLLVLTVEGVNLTLGTYRGLLRGQRAGRYKLTVTLTQGGRRVLHSTRSVRLT